MPIRRGLPKIFPVFSPAARAHRCLRGLASYRPCDHIRDVPQLAEEESPLGRGETLLGIYENVPGGRSELLLFTDYAVYWLVDEAWHTVRLREIAGFPLVVLPKMALADVTVFTTDGRSIRIPVRGGTECTRDAYAVWTYLLNVSGDVEKLDQRAEKNTGSP